METQVVRGKMMRVRLSDEECVARIRRAHDRRRVSGAVALLVGIGMIAFGWISVREMSRRSLEMIDAAVEMQHAGQEQLAVAIAQATDESRYTTGMLMGFVLGKAAAVGMILVAIGLHALVGRDRKTELLLSCADRNGGLES